MPHFFEDNHSLIQHSTFSICID
uniref:Uncharacterized protein n=1 Tax=Arundo donax TaxID=35708 RepID=A0A0A8ZCJ9_ARUDO